MNSVCYSASLAVLLLLASPPGYAASLECDGTIVSQGDSEQQLLDACGSPVSRSGADWRYVRPGSLPVVVTVGEGMVMFIRDADEVPEAPADPLGDRP
jgi:hypothetical protein